MSARNAVPARVVQPLEYVTRCNPQIVRGPLEAACRVEASFPPGPVPNGAVLFGPFSWVYKKKDMGIGDVRGRVRFYVVPNSMAFR